MNVGGRVEIVTRVHGSYCYTYYINIIYSARTTQLFGTVTDWRECATVVEWTRSRGIRDQW